MSFVNPLPSEYAYPPQDSPGCTMVPCCEYLLAGGIVLQGLDPNSYSIVHFLLHSPTYRYATLLGGLGITSRGRAYFIFHFLVSTIVCLKPYISCISGMGGEGLKEEQQAEVLVGCRAESLKAWGSRS